MALFKRTPARANTTPVLDRGSGQSFGMSIAKVLAIPIVLLGSLSSFGSPALRMSYRWNGNQQAPVYSECLYLNLTSGWQRVHPSYGVNNCPLLHLFPFNLSEFLGV